MNAATISRLLAWRLSVRRVVLSLAALLFVLFCVLPAVYMLGVSMINAGGGLSLGNYLLLNEPRQRSLLLNSTLLGAGSAALSILLGAPPGLLLARSGVRGLRWWRLLLAMPLVIPPYVLALAWTWLAASAGLAAEQTYTLAGAVLVLGVGFYPLVMLAAEAAARRVDVRLEEAALLVATPRRVFARITLPLVAPAITATALVVFALAVSEFGVPGLLRVNVYTTEVFTAFAALYDFGRATALSAPLLAITLLATIAARFLIGERALATRRSLKAEGLRIPGRWSAGVSLFFTLIIAACVALPLVTLMLEAGRPGRVAGLLADSGGAIGNSLLLAALGATCVVALAALPGYARARGRRAVLLDLVFIGLFAVPGTVVGVGLIGLWNRSGWMGWIYDSPLIILIAYLARFVPAAALMLAAGVRQIPISYEEAAAVAGASWWRSFTRIVLPNLRLGMAAAWAVVFVLAFGELGATILVAPPGESTLPVRVYTLIANAPAGKVAALALLQAAIALLPLVLLALILRGAGRRALT